MPVDAEKVTNGSRGGLAESLGIQETANAVASMEGNTNGLGAVCSGNQVNNELVIPETSGDIGPVNLSPPESWVGLLMKDARNSKRTTMRWPASPALRPFIIAPPACT